MARARLEAGQTDIALNLYRFVADNGTPRAIRMVARERLARVLLDQDRPEEAMALLEGDEELAGFEAAFAEVRGDIHAALGESEQAVSSYQQALDSLEAGVGDRSFLELKIKALGGEPAETDSEDGSQS